MSGLPPYQFLPPGHPAWQQALMAQQQAQIAAQVTTHNHNLVINFAILTSHNLTTVASPLTHLCRCKRRRSRRRRWWRRRRPSRPTPSTSSSRVACRAPRPPAGPSPACPS